MSDLRIFPLKQGDLDWLCSIYAAINLRHLRNSKFSISSADELFKELIETQLPAQKWNVGRYVAQGVDPNTDIVQLFKAAGFASVEAIDFSTEKIAAECRKQSGLLIFIKETTEHCDCFSHYTIANCVTQSGDIELYDSWKFERLTRLGGDLKAGNLDVMKRPGFSGGYLV